MAIAPAGYLPTAPTPRGGTRPAAFLQTRDHVGDENIQHRGQDRRHQVEPVGGAEQEQAGPAEQGPFAAGLAEFIGADRDRDGVIR